MGILLNKNKVNTDEKVKLIQDKALFEKFAPAGGISFKEEKYIVTGGGYEQCIHVYEYPDSVNSNWLLNISNQKNSITTIDISTDDIIEVKRNLNKSIKEQKSRYMSSTQESDAIDARQRYEEMQNLIQEISVMGEVMKLSHLRIFVFGRTKSELDERVKNIMASLESDNYKLTTLLYEEKEEWESQFKSYSDQSNRNFTLKGLPLTTKNLGLANPFHYSSLYDSYGDFIGSTDCGGILLFDPFFVSDKRTYYNGVVVGEMGSGKSTLLKKIFLARAIRGDVIRTFDIVGDFTLLTKTLGGKILNLSGVDGMLNPLEILASSESEVKNFSNTLAKCKTIYNLLFPNLTDNEITTFQNNLEELYEKFNLIPKGGNKVTGLSPNSYPTFSDFYKFIENKIKNITSSEVSNLEKTVVDEKLKRLLSLQENLKRIIKVHGHALDGHTTLENIFNEQIITFNISDFKKGDEREFDAVLYNILSLCWDNLIKQGAPEKTKFENGEVPFEDVKRFMILIDEAHNWVNSSKLLMVDQLIKYEREARKYFGGIWLASQSIKDFAPEASANSEALSKLKTLFELTQYKFIFRQSSSVIDYIGKLFGSELSEPQRQEIPTLEKGSALLCISGDQIINADIFLSDREKKIFAGGL